MYHHKEKLILSFLTDKIVLFTENYLEQNMYFSTHKPYLLYGNWIISGININKLVRVSRERDIDLGIGSDRDDTDIHKKRGDVMEIISQHYEGEESPHPLSARWRPSTLVGSAHRQSKGTQASTPHDSGSLWAAFLSWKAACCACRGRLVSITSLWRLWGGPGRKVWKSGYSDCSE